MLLRARPAGAGDVWAGVSLPGSLEQGHRGHQGGEEQASVSEPGHAGDSSGQTGETKPRVVLLIQSVVSVQSVWTSGVFGFGDGNSYFAGKRVHRLSLKTCPFCCILQGSIRRSLYYTCACGKLAKLLCGSETGLRSKSLRRPFPHPKMKYKKMNMKMKQTFPVLYSNNQYETLSQLTSFVQAVRVGLTPPSVFVYA